MNIPLGVQKDESRPSRGSTVQLELSTFRLWDGRHRTWLPCPWAGRCHHSERDICLVLLSIHHQIGVLAIQFEALIYVHAPLLSILHIPCQILLPLCNTMIVVIRTTTDHKRLSLFQISACLSNGIETSCNQNHWAESYPSPIRGRAEQLARSLT